MSLQDPAPPAGGPQRRAVRYSHAATAHSHRHRLSHLAFTMLLALSAGCSHTGAPFDARITALDTAPPLPAISGLAPLTASDFLFVNDARGPARTLPALDRIGVLSVANDDTASAVWLPLDVTADDLPQDLEAVAPDPRSPGRFFLLESGSGRVARRLFIVSVQRVSDRWTAKLVAPALDLRPWTADLDNTESIVAMLDESTGNVTITIADRAPIAAHTEAAATEQDSHDVNVVSLVLRDSTVISTRSWILAGPSRPASTTTSPIGINLQAHPRAVSWRECSDLFLARDGTLLIASTSDGGDHGPFESIISNVGRFSGHAFTPAPAITTISIPNTKVEAIAPWNHLRGVVLLASDDESQGGRAMLSPIPPPSPSP